MLYQIKSSRLSFTFLRLSGWLQHEVLSGCSSSLSQHAKEFVCSIVVGNDLIPRLGFPSILRLKQKMIAFAHQSSEPKVCSQVFKLMSELSWKFCTFM